LRVGLFYRGMCFLPVGLTGTIVPAVFRNNKVKSLSHGLGCSSMEKCLPSMCKALGLIPSTKKEKEKKKHISYYFRIFHVGIKLKAPF
jgi:hypothetical protein